MSMTFRRGAVVSGVIIGLTAVAAVAAPPGAQSPVAPSSSPTRNAPSTEQGAAVSPQSMEARVDQHITQLHTQLQITPAQEPAWQKFAQTMRNNARKMDEAFANRIDQMPTMNATANMKSYAQIAKQHAEDVRALVTPFEALYASMSESQKQNADQVFREDANRGPGGQVQGAQAQHG